MRGSGGGTGLYEQNEAHFHVHQGELREVLTFVSRRRSCPVTPVRLCEVERRWFRGEMLVEARGTMDGEAIPRVAYMFRDLEQQYTQTLTCQPYIWDDATFRYVSQAPAIPCGEATAR